MKLIGLSGPLSVGKDTIADYLVETYDFTKFSFSDALYKQVSEAFNVSIDALQDRDQKEVPQEWLRLNQCNDGVFIALAKRLIEHDDPLHQPLSPRWVLQRWGTDYRRAEDPAYWIKRSAEFVRAWLEVQAESDNPRAGLVNSSTRFPNECEFIRGLNGEVWHINRADWDRRAEGNTATYVSEKRLPVDPRDKVLHNNSTIAKLNTAASLLLQSPPGTVLHVEDEQPDMFVECQQCGFVHRAMTRAEAKQEVINLNSAAEMSGQEVITVVSESIYEGCDRCGGTTFERVSGPPSKQEREVPPVIYEVQ